MERAGLGTRAYDSCVTGLASLGSGACTVCASGLTCVRFGRYMLMRLVSPFIFLCRLVLQHLRRSFIMFMGARRASCAIVRRCAMYGIELETCTSFVHEWSCSCGAPYIIGHSMEASMKAHGTPRRSMETPRRSPWRSVEVQQVSMEVRGGSMEASMEVHGGSVDWRSVEASVEVRGGSMEASMEVHGDLHTRRSPRTSIKASIEPPRTSTDLHGGPMELHEVSWRSPRRLMELHGGLYGAPWSSVEVSMECPMT